MKKIFFIFISIIILSSCVTTSQKEKWAKELGYVKPSEVTIPEQPDHVLLPHPELPLLDENDFSQETLMKEIILMNGSIEKFEILVEIYEREYINSKGSNKKFENLSLDQLKKEYFNLIKDNKKDNSIK